MRLSSLLDALPEALAPTALARVRASDDPTIRGVRYDSRQVSPGDLFVALRGANSDQYSGDTRGARDRASRRSCRGCGARLACG